MVKNGRDKKRKNFIKINRYVSISLKLTIMIVLVSLLLISALLWFNLSEREYILNKSFVETGFGISQTINASIQNFDELKTQDKLQDFIYKVYTLNPDVSEITVTMPDDNGDLKIYVSSNNASIGEYADSNNVRNINYTYLCYKNEDNYTLIDSNTQILTCLTPLFFYDEQTDMYEVVGTYEISLSLQEAYKVLENQRQLQILFSIMVLFAIIFIFLFLLRRYIVKPIRIFRDAAHIIGEGNLNKKIDISSRDELGELASSFNRMTAELKSSRSKIERYSKTLEGLLKQKDEFIGQLGHDLKNPLTPLVGLLPIIVDKEKDPELKKHLQIISTNVEYMRDLIFKTLALAKLRSSNVQFDFEDLNLLDEVKSVVESQQLFLKDNKITITNNVEGRIFVWADKLRLSELFKNLITNAVKYTDSSGGVITIDASVDNDFVTVSINDSGIGMAKEQLEFVFDEFYKADKTSSEMVSSGLGLSICNRIVDKHGGRIWAESPGPGKGSTFYFTLKVGKGKNS